MEIRRWARKCSRCNTGMYEGYVFADGEHYACSEQCRDAICHNEYDSISWEQLAKDEDVSPFYWTQWQEHFDDMYEEIDGEFTQINL